MDEEDSLLAYERRGIARGPPPDTHDAGMEAMMSSFDHTQQVEMLHGKNGVSSFKVVMYLVTGYATMKEDLVEFLKGFSNTGKVMKDLTCAF